MHPALRSLPAALLLTGLTAPAAGAADQVVLAPAPGITSISISDQAEPGKVVLTALTPVAAGHFSTAFLDLDDDGAADRAVVVTRGALSGSVRVLSTPDSVPGCQQHGGRTALAIPGATGAFLAGGTGWVARLPVDSVAGGFDWKLASGTPGGDAVCGSTDGGVLGLALDLGDARTFDEGPDVPAADTTAPAVPTDLTAVPDDGSVTLDWSDVPDDDLASYLVHRQVGTGPYTLVAEPATSHLLDVDLPNGTPVTYYVKAVDAAGNVSAESSKVTAIPAARPAATPPVVDVVPPVTVPGSPLVPKDPLAPFVPPAGAVNRGTVGGAEVWALAGAAARPQYDGRSGKVVAGMLRNAETVPSTVTTTYSIRVPKPRTRSLRSHFTTRKVTIGRSTTKLAPGELKPMTFTLNAAGRKAARAGRTLSVRAALRVQPKGRSARSGAVTVTLARKVRR